MPRLPSRFALLCLFATLAGPAATGPALAQPSTPPSDLDVLMKEVLARREDNRLLLQQYVLDEVERFSVTGPGRTPLFGRSRDFAWYIRDGLHVRSPVRMDGVAVGDKEREAYEREWMKDERERLARRDERAKERGEPPPPVADAATAGAANLPIAAPRFVSEAYFLEFKFEPGNYFLAGRETLDGRPVLRIEYYPTRMFNGDDERDEKKEDGGARRERSAKEASEEARIEHGLNKTSLVTLWVDPAERQIVKYTFDNVWMDFLPGAWLARVDDMHASMRMGQPFPGVWLPLSLEVEGAVSMANGQFGVEYSRTFSNYRLAETKSTIRVPKEEPAPEPSGPDTLEDAGGPGGPYAGDQAQAPAAAPQAAQETPVTGQEIVREVRVHGNASVPDAEVLRIAGLEVGQPIDGTGLDAIQRRLRAAGLFDTIEVRKRYRSLADPSDVAIILLVHERAGVTVTTSGDVRKPGAASWFTRRLQFLPILGYEDGYGWTYGARFSTTNLLGAKERLSVPLSWGGTRRAELELQRGFSTGPISLIEAGGGIRQQENPRFDLDDQRVGVRGRAERRFLHVLSAGAVASYDTIDFGGVDDALTTVGADLVVDTRQNRAFPRNAVVARAAWTGLSFDSVPDRIDRIDAGARGYVALIGQSVLAVRLDYSGASATLPPSDRLLLGGWASLRGIRAGSDDGDRRLLTSAEVRLPLTSVMSGAKLGVLAFYDRGRIWDAVERFEEAPWRAGTGAGVFVIAPVLTLNLDVAHGFPDGDTRVHFGMGFSF